MMAITCQSMAGIYIGIDTLWPSGSVTSPNGSSPSAVDSIKAIMAKTPTMIDFLACSFSSSASAATRPASNRPNMAVTPADTSGA